MKGRSRIATLRDLTGWILMGAALLLGAVAFLMIRSYLDTREEQLRREMLGERPDVVKVVVATRPLDAGDVISERNVALGRLPRAHVSPRMIRAVEFDDIRYKVLSRGMTPGEPLLRDFLAGVVAERFSDLLQPGERAVSLEAKSLDNISGMLLPGDFIDLYSIIKTGGKHKSVSLVPVLERVKVLAAGEQPLRNSEQAFQPLSERDVENYRQITVGLATPDAEKLLLAKEQGRIVYLLRNADDYLPGALVDRDKFSEERPPGYIYHSDASTQGVWLPVNAGQAHEPAAEPFPLEEYLEQLWPEPDAVSPAAPATEVDQLAQAGPGDETAERPNE